MDDQLREETMTGSTGNGSGGREPFERETLADDGAGAAGDVEVEVVLVSNDESGGDFPRTLTDDSGSAFRWYMVAPGVVAAGIAGVLLLQRRSEGGVAGASQAVQNRAASALQSLGAASGSLGSLPNVKGLVRKTVAPPPKSQWEQTRDSVGQVLNDNAVTLIAIAASVGITLAGRLVDVKRDGAVELPPAPVSTPWYRGGLWS